jgi:hypothetical protein
MCRQALEILARGFERLLELDGSSGSSYKLDDTLHSIIHYYDGLGLFKQSQVWRELQRQKGVWNRIVHRNRALGSDDAIKEVEFFHRISWTLCSFHRDPKNPIVDAPVFVARPGTWGQLRDERTARRLDAQRLSELEAELTRQRQRASDQSESEQAIAAELKQARRDLEEATATVKALSARRPESSVSPELQKMLLAAEGRAADFASKADALAAQLSSARAERESAQERVSILEETFIALRGEIKKALDARESLERAERRRLRYEREYPGIERAHEFFQASIEGDDHGPLPPLDGLDSAIELPADRYASRFESVFCGASCTLRVIRVHAGVGTEERCRAWEIEATNLSRLTQLRGRSGIAGLISGGVEGKPGFAVFERSTSFVLSQFGSGGKGLRLTAALCFTDALYSELSARAAANMSVSWPDLDAIGVRGSLPVLLEPSAPHAGNLGPPEWIGRSADQCRQMTREELERGWTYALAHAILRSTAFLPTTCQADVLRTPIQEAHLRSFLEEGRRRCDEPLSLDAVRELAPVLVGALEIEGRKRPLLEQLVFALRAPLNHS